LLPLKNTPLTHLSSARSAVPWRGLTNRLEKRQDQMVVSNALLFSWLNVNCFQITDVESAEMNRKDDQMIGVRFENEHRDDKSTGVFVSEDDDDSGYESEDDPEYVPALFSRPGPRTLDDFTTVCNTVGWTQGGELTILIRMDRKKLPCIASTYAASGYDDSQYRRAEC
jgi:hypothetical protein